MLTQQQYSDIFTQLLDERVKHGIKQDVSDTYHEHMFPDSHAPVVDDGQVNGILFVLKMVNPDIEDWFNWFLFELPSLKQPSEISFNGEKFTADYKKPYEFLQFILKIHNIN